MPNVTKERLTEEGKGQESAEESQMSIIIGDFIAFLRTLLPQASVIGRRILTVFRYQFQFCEGIYGRKRNCTD
jgi:hypothetical protein